MPRPGESGIPITRIEDFQAVTWSIEIQDSSGNTILKVFLPIPPDRESRTFPQRITIDKTIGGEAVYNYGTDIAPIELQGNTGSPSRIYVVNAFSSRIIGSVGRRLNGAKIYDFMRDDLAQWAKNFGINDDMRKGRNTKIILRDLYNREKYEAVMEEIIFERDKSNPLWYNYRIRFTSLTATFDIKDAGKISVFKLSRQRDKSLQDVKRSLRVLGNNARRFMNKKVQPFKNFLAKVDRVSRDFTFFVNTIPSAINLTKEQLDNVLRLVGGLLANVSDIINQYKEIVTDPGDDFYFELTNIKFSLQKIRASVRKTPITENVDIVDPVQNFDDRHGNLPSPTREIEDVDIGPVKTVSQSIEDSVLYEVKESDTLESIAIKFYSDIDKWQDIAQINDVGGLDLEPGQILIIPGVGRKSISNVIAVNREDRFGTDIRVEDGKFVASSTGDTSFIAGFDNLKQSVRHRTKTRKGTHPKHPAYGLGNFLIGLPMPIAVQISGTDAEEEYEKDDRILSARTNIFSVDGDIFEADITLETISGNTQKVRVNNGG